MNRKGLIEKLEIKERQILRKILGPIKENCEFSKRHSRELYTFRKDHMRKDCFLLPHCLYEFNKVEQ